MAGFDLSEVLKRLPKLSAKDLAQVQLRLNYLTKTTATPPLQQDWLLLGLTSELRRRGLWMNKYPIPARLLPVGYLTKADAVKAHLLKGYKNPHPRLVECAAIGALGAGALAEYLIRAKVPLGPKSLLMNLEKMPAALEAAFPGYWEASMFGLAVGLSGDDGNLSVKS